MPTIGGSGDGTRGFRPDRPADADIPILKKKEKERKGGAPPLWGSNAAQEAEVALGAGRAGGGALSDLALGAGSRGAAAGARVFLPPLINFLTSNLGMGLLAGITVGAAVFGLYSMNMAAMRGGRASSGRGIFAQRKAEVPEPAPIKGAGDGSLGYLSAANKGALDGSPSASAQSPDAAAAAGDAAKSDGKSDRDAAAGPVGAAGDAPAPGAGLPDMKMGKMTSSLGSGNGLAGGGGMAGGIMKAFKEGVLGAKPDRGTLVAMKPASSRTAVSRVPNSPIRGGGRGAFAQLKKATAESQVGKAAPASEAQSFHSAEAFTGAPAGQASSIGGAGMNAGGVSNGGAGAGSSTNPDGAPIVNPAPAVAPTAPSVGSGQDVTPWASLVMMAQSMLMIASLIITIIGIIAMFKNEFSWNAPVWEELNATQQVFFGIATALAAAATVMGVIIMAGYGQMAQGGIITTGGAITTAAAAAAIWAPTFAPAWVVVLAGAAGMATSIGGLLTSKV